VVFPSKACTPKAVLFIDPLTGDKRLFKPIAVLLVAVTENNIPVVLDPGSPTTCAVPWPVVTIVFIFPSKGDTAPPMLPVNVVTAPVALDA
jgi:hypothetical protein